MQFRVYIAKELLLILLLIVSQVIVQMAHHFTVVSNQLIKFEQVAQSIRQQSCQSAFDLAVRMAVI